MHNDYSYHEFSQRPRPIKKRRRRTGLRAAILIMVCLLFASAAGFVGGAVMTVMFGPGLNIPVSLPEAPPQTAQDMEEPNVLVSAPEESEIRTLTTADAQCLTAPEVAALVTPSVVEIKTETMTAAARGIYQIREGAGSGVIISADGYIVTNNHVIENARSVTVRLHDGREHAAKIIGRDVQTDLAVLKIDAYDLTPAVWGNSANIQVAEPVFAVGNPLGELGGTVTGGMISALDRDIIIENQRMTLLQTDAAVNPGNSGGGLFNMRGELIGIVNAKSAGLNIEGLGFAIPVNTAYAVVSDILTHGFVRGRIDTGLELVDIQTVQAAMANRVSQQGLYIVSSRHAEFRNGDRIVGIDGHTVTNLGSFNAVLAVRSVGDTVSITVARGNYRVSHEITLTEFRPPGAHL